MRPFGAIAQPKMTPYGIISAWGDAMYFQRIRDVREDHDKTQQEIADMLHMQRSVYAAMSSANARSRSGRW